VSAALCVGAGPNPIGSVPTLDVTGVGVSAVVDVFVDADFAGVVNAGP
jgi:hypothetical protein